MGIDHLPKVQGAGAHAEVLGQGPVEPLLGYALEPDGRSVGQKGRAVATGAGTPVATCHRHTEGRRDVR